LLLILTTVPLHPSVGGAVFFILVSERCGA
jgi:hypothetical protein